MGWTYDGTPDGYQIVRCDGPAWNCKDLGTVEHKPANIAVYPGVPTIVMVRAINWGELSNFSATFTVDEFGELQ